MLDLLTTWSHTHMIDLMVARPHARSAYLMVAWPHARSAYLNLLKVVLRFPGAGLDHQQQHDGRQQREKVVPEVARISLQVTITINAPTATSCFCRYQTRGENSSYGQ